MMMDNPRRNGEVREGLTASAIFLKSKCCVPPNTIFSSLSLVFDLPSTAFQNAVVSGGVMDRRCDSAVVARVLGLQTVKPS